MKGNRKKGITEARCLEILLPAFEENTLSAYQRAKALLVKEQYSMAFARATYSYDTQLAVYDLHIILMKEYQRQQRAKRKQAKNLDRSERKLEILKRRALNAPRFNKK